MGNGGQEAKAESARLKKTMGEFLSDLPLDSVHLYAPLIPYASKYNVLLCGWTLNYSAHGG